MGSLTDMEVRSLTSINVKCFQCFKKLNLLVFINMYEIKEENKTLFLLLNVQPNWHFSLGARVAQYCGQCMHSKIIDHPAYGMC